MMAQARGPMADPAHAEYAEEAREWGPTDAWCEALRRTQRCETLLTAGSVHPEIDDSSLTSVEPPESGSHYPQSRSR